MKIRLLESKRCTGALNMGIDEMLFTQYASGILPTLRFYLWDRPTLSLGYFQRSSRFTSIWGSEDTGLVRRMTGGRGVIHHMELTYSVVGGYDPLFQGKDLQETYGIIAGYFQNAFSSMGIEMELSKGVKTGDSDNCFDSPSLYEMTIDGMKVIGSAQYRSRGKFLQHGSIILDIDHKLWASIYGVPADRMADTVKGINDLAHSSITHVDVEKAIISAFGSDHDLETIPLSPDEEKIAENLAVEKYSSREFTFRR